MKAHENLAAYEGFEDLNSFTELSFQRYCEAKLEGCRADVALIRKHCVQSQWTGKICEIGSGNSKLLYALEQDGILEAGLGLEVSSSRHKFAEKFKRCAGSTKTKNLNADVFALDPLHNFDLICAMDIVLQMITPISSNATKKLFGWIKASLKPGGHLIAELRDFQQFMEIMKLSENQAYQFWEEFPATDPWKYNLNRLTFVDGETAPDIRWEKTFLKRDSQETSKTQCVWRPYTIDSFKELVGQHGLRLLTTLAGRPGSFIAIVGNPDN
jgi:hypothetical protein